MLCRLIIFNITCNLFGITFHLFGVFVAVSHLTFFIPSLSFRWLAEFIVLFAFIHNE